MLEFMLSGGNPKSSAYLQLTTLQYTGTPPGWTGYTNNLIFQPNKKRFVLSGVDTYKYPFDLEANAFTARSSFPRTLSYGSRFSEADSLDGYLVRWGQSNGNYVASALYYNGNDVGINVPVSSTSTGYFHQCTVGDTFYLFGGTYGKSVEGTNDMRVFICSGSNTSIRTDGTVTTDMPVLTYNAYCGHTKDAIYMFGGVNSTSSGNSVTSDVWCYVLSTKRWSKVSTTPIPISGGGNTPFYDGKFWFLGATASNTEASLQQLWSYRVSDGLWSLEADYAELAGCRNGSLFVYNDKLYYILPMVSGRLGTNIFTINLK